ncbi:MAG: ankyrin repeat domain-containing protein [Planctomycetales bacterium]
MISFIVRSIIGSSLILCLTLATAGAASDAEEIVPNGSQPLAPHQLAAQGRVMELAARLDQEPDLLQEREWSSTKQPLLHAAAMHGRLATLRLLIARGADVNLTDSRGVTALHLAALYGRCVTAHLLLDQGAELEPRTPPRFIAGLPAGSYTPAEFAVAGGRAEVLELLLDRGATLDQEPPAMDRLIEPASREGRRAVLNVLLCRLGKQELSDRLAAAVETQRLEEIEALAELGAPILTALQEGFWGAPLHWAIAHGQSEFALFLIDHGADVNQVSGGTTPLFEAAQHGDLALVRGLLAHDAAVDVGNTDVGTTPLQFAVYKGHRDCVELLLQKGANPARIRPAAREELARSAEPKYQEILELLRRAETVPPQGTLEAGPRGGR